MKALQEGQTHGVETGPEVRDGHRHDGPCHRPGEPPRHRDEQLHRPDEQLHHPGGLLLPAEEALPEVGFHPGGRTAIIEKETGAEGTETGRGRPHDEEASTHQGPEPHTFTLTILAESVIVVQTLALSLTSTLLPIKLQEPLIPLASFIYMEGELDPIPTTTSSRSQPVAWLLLTTQIPYPSPKYESLDLKVLRTVVMAETKGVVMVYPVGTIHHLPRMSSMTRLRYENLAPKNHVLSPLSTQLQAREPVPMSLAGVVAMVLVWSVPDFMLISISMHMLIIMNLVMLRVISSNTLTVHQWPITPATSLLTLPQRDVSDTQMVPVDLITITRLIPSTESDPDPAIRETAIYAVPPDEQCPLKGREVAHLLAAAHVVSIDVMTGIHPRTEDSHRPVTRPYLQQFPPGIPRDRRPHTAHQPVETSGQFLSLPSALDPCPDRR